MTFDELFESYDKKLEKCLKTNDNWRWENIEDFHTHEWKKVAKCYIDKDDKILFFIKKKDLKIKDTFYIEGIGLLEFNYNSCFAKYYVELIEKETTII